MIDNGRSELTSGKYIQTEEEILSGSQKLESNRKTLFLLLDRLAAM
jgi:hypothetical protein